MRPTATFGPYDGSGPLPCIQGEGLRAAEARGFEPRKGVNPNRISSPFGWPEQGITSPYPAASAQVNGGMPHNPGQRTPSPHKPLGATTVPSGMFVWCPQSRVLRSSFGQIWSAALKRALGSVAGLWQVIRGRPDP